jgi:hypothetical protein
LHFYDNSTMGFEKTLEEWLRKIKNWPKLSLYKIDKTIIIPIEPSEQLSCSEHKREWTIMRQRYAGATSSFKYL